MNHRAFRHIPSLGLDLQLVDGGCNFDSARVFSSYNLAANSEGEGRRMKTADHDSISLSRRFSFRLKGGFTLATWSSLLLLMRWNQVCIGKLIFGAYYVISSKCYRIHTSSGVHKCDKKYTQ